MGDDVGMRRHPSQLTQYSDKREDWMDPAKQANRSGRVTLIFSDSSQSGTSLVGVLIATGLLGIVAVATMRIFGDASKNTRNLKDKVDLVSVGNYILQFTDCAKTQADPGFAAITDCP